MGLFDQINNVQVYCFGNNLKHYNTGDKLPLKTRTYQYPDNIVFIQTIYPGVKPYQKQVHIVRDGVIKNTLEVGDLKRADMENIEGVFSDTGKKLNIESFDDLVNFMYEDCKLQLDIDFLVFKDYNNESLNNEREELEKAFYEKWYK